MEVNPAYLATLSDVACLGVAPEHWPRMCADARSLGFPEWRAVWAATRPARCSPGAWDALARSVYEVGPLALWLARSMN